jgi:flagellar basal-body rod protein FlgF
MSRDLYAAYSGASAAWRQLEVLSNNLANANTAGFREARVTFSLAAGDPSSPIGAAFAQADGIGYSQEDGALIQDGVSTHLALRGEGFFALQDGSFTRDGGFRVDADGTVVTADGTAVLTDNGPVRLDPGERLTVSADGVASGSRNGEFGRLRIVSLAGGAPSGGNRWTGTPTPVAEGAVTVLQGMREGSNADPLRGMVELIEASKFFEAQQKAMQASDEMRQRLNRLQGG